MAIGAHGALSALVPRPVAMEKKRGVAFVPILPHQMEENHVQALQLTRRIARSRTAQVTGEIFNMITLDSLPYFEPQ